MYNTLIGSFLTVVLVNIISTDQNNIIYGITAFGILLCATFTLVAVFGTKVGHHVNVLANSYATMIIAF